MVSSYPWSTTTFSYLPSATTVVTVAVDLTGGAPSVTAQIPMATGPITLNPGAATLNSGAEMAFGAYFWLINATASPQQILWRRADAQPILSSVSSISSQPSAADSTSTTSVGLTTSPTVAPSPTVTQTCTAKSGKQISTVSSGAAAGAAIVCLIAGAAIAALALWFFWGRRKESRARNCDASSTALVHHEKGFTTNTIPLESRNPATLSITDAFPMPLEDKAITGEILKISNSIKNHVQSYYHASEISPGLLDIDDVKALGSDLPIPVATLSSLLDKKASREIALRFCVAWVVCSNMRPEASSSTGLLPTEVAECLRKMVESSRGSRAHTSSVARWRVMTADLTQTPYVRDPFTASDSRNASIRAALGKLETVLQPYADSCMDNTQRRRNLEEVLKRSALFAFTLFSQPSTWDFDWREESGVKSNQLCIFPALVQLTSEPGRPHDPPVPFSEATFRSLDS